MRAWRNKQSDVTDAVLPKGVGVSASPAVGLYRGGLLFCPPHVRTDALIVHFHGGGFVVGSPQTHSVVAAWIAGIFGCRVLLPNYRLAPEHRLPAQASDAVAALEFARKQLATSIVLSGDSAGAMVALWGHQFSPEPIRAAVHASYLYYGAFGQPALTPYGLTAPEDDGLGPRSLSAAYRRIDPKWDDQFSPPFSPFSHGFKPPAGLIIVGAGDDPLLEQSERLNAHFSGHSKLKVIEGKGHGFLSQPKPDEKTVAFLSDLAESRDH